MTGIDFDHHAHTGAQRWQGPIARLDAHAHRDALHDLYPVTAGVLRRQKRELLGRRPTDALDSAAPLPIRICIDRHRDRLARLHICHLSLLRICVDPDVICGDQEEGGCRGLKILAGCNRWHVRHDAGEWRLDNGVVELTRCLVALCNRITILWMLFNREIGLPLRLATIAASW